MTAPVFAVTLMLALAQTQPREVTFQGCMTPGIDKDTYILNPVTVLAEPQGGLLPEAAHGRRVFFWFDNDGELRKNGGRMVEVRGTVTGLEESEIELKAGRQKDGGLIVEFEGPGRDVRAPNATVGSAVGTGGRVVPEKNDLKAYLVRITVKEVKATGTC